VKFEATVKEIRALLQLAEIDRGPARAQAGGSSRRREALRSCMPRLLVERYGSLVDAGYSPAVVAIERGACSGCHLRLPTMVEYAARRTPAVHTCPHCRRMLYTPELVSEDPHANAGNSRRTAPPSAARRH
jgi:hypothetical protein